MTTYLVGAGGYGGQGDEVFATEFTSTQDMEWRRITGCYYYKVEAGSKEEAERIGRENHKKFKRLSEAVHNILYQAQKRYRCWPTIDDMGEIIEAHRRYGW